MFAWLLQQKRKRKRIHDVSVGACWICLLVTICHSRIWQYASRKKFDSFFVFANLGTPTLPSDDWLFASMIIKSMNAPPDVIALFCLCWHIEGWNIVIGMHYHPSLNWDQSQEGLCKCTLIWESVCPGQNQQCQEAGWEAFTQSQESLAPTAQNMCWSRCWSCFAFLLLTVFIIRLEIVEVIGWYVSRLTLLVQSSFSPLLIYKFGVMDHFKNNHNAYQSSNDHSHLHIPL